MLWSVAGSRSRLRLDLLHNTEPSRGAELDRNRFSGPEWRPSDLDLYPIPFFMNICQKKLRKGLTFGTRRLKVLSFWRKIQTGRIIRIRNPFMSKYFGSFFVCNDIASLKIPYTGTGTSNYVSYQFWTIVAAWMCRSRSRGRDYRSRSRSYGRGGGRREDSRDRRDYRSYSRGR